MMDYSVTMIRNKLNSSQMILQSSGLNNRFLGDGLSFIDYIELMRNVIIESRLDLIDENVSIIIAGNSPFSWQSTTLTSSTKKFKNGILLIHGLYDSPFFLADIGKHFLKNDFIVNAILLPGHGTVPGDLLDIEYPEWIRAVNYGIECLAERCEHVYIAGYSLGGILALRHAFQSSACKGLFLFAPVLKPISSLKYMLARYYRLFSWASNKGQWYQIAEQNNYMKYCCYTFNAAYQACQLIADTRTIIRKKSLDIPIFIAMSEDDEIISKRAVLSFFIGQPNLCNKLILYTNSHQNPGNEKIIVRNSSYPHHNILNFSHTCLTIAPENNYLGINSAYKDFSHYRNLDSLKTAKIYQGAISKKDLHRYTLQRLSYNPDFHYLLQSIDDFLTSAVTAQHH
jgi:esterase/lipase